MLAKKNRNYCGLIIFLVLGLFIAGCTPPGPRALFKGKKLLERGDYAAAVEQFKKATTLLPADAQAWNYLGAACQRAGQPADAAAAYQRALTLNRDLVETHYNLGSLWLEQNKPDAAITEFTAYTLRRANEPEGWLKLGSAQLHASDFLAAEKSFSTALALSTNNAEALNGLGLARIERGRPREASQYFAAAIQFHPDYAPALLNLATVAHDNLHDNKLALQNYRAYLALTPRPANWDAVNEIANRLDQPESVAAAAPPAAAAVQHPPAAAPPTVASEPKPPTVVRTTTPAKTPPPATTPPPGKTPPPVAKKPATKFSTLPPRQASSPPPQEVRVQPEPEIVTTPGKAVVVTGSPLSSPPSPSYFETGVTPLPSLNPAAPADSAFALSSSAQTGSAAESKPVVRIVPPVFARYGYLSPGKPDAGNHGVAASAFARARDYEVNASWADALEWYRRATVADPGWFEAQYNYGVLASRLRNYSAALSAYEMALAIQPDSVNARYNFALALKAAGYATDAVNELEKILAANPNEIRAQLALGNLYAQQMRDPAKARPHYLKVLELDPHNPQATDIRFWLSSNPG